MIDRLNRQSAAWLAGTVVLFGGLIVAVDLPIRSMQSGHRDRIAQAERSLAGSSDAATQLAQLNDEMVELREETRSIQQRIPQANETAEVIRGISQAMERHAADEPILTTGPVEHYATHSLIPIQVSFRADFDNAYRVMDALRSMPRLIRIERMTLSREGGELGRPMPISLEVAAFFSRPDQFAAVAGGEGTR
ncbi:MAG: type 4a pilus biogenesis protein PilO [Planctomycetota bacterium]